MASLRVGRVVVAVGALALLGCGGSPLVSTVVTPGADGGAAAPGADPSPGPAPVPIAPPGPAPVPIAPTPAPAWTEIEAPAELGLAGLDVTDAAAAGPDDFFFAANLPADAPNRPDEAQAKVVRWTRGHWTVELTAPAPVAWIARVSATAPDDAWAVLGTTLYRRDASGWQAFDEPAGATPYPAGPMRAGGRGEVWVMASGTLLHWASGAWQVFPIAIDEPNIFYYAYSAIWVAGANDVWLGGAMNHVDGGPIYNPALLMHFDGTTFTKVPFGLWNVFGLWGDGGGGVWAAAPNNIVGNASLTIFHGAAIGGSAGGFVPIDDGWPEGGEVHALWGRGADDVWAAGDDVAHWDGATWSRSADAPAGARAPQNGGATLVTGDAGSTWLVARGPHFFRFGPPAQ